jgi:cytochrome P450
MTTGSADEDAAPELLSGQRMPAPRGPRGRWLVGATEFIDDPLGCITRWPRQYGDVYQLRVGFHRLAHVSGAANIEQVLLTRARSFRKGVFERGAQLFAGNGLLLSEGDFWKRQRRLMSPPFHHKALGMYADTMVAIGDRVAAGWGDGEIRDLFVDTQRITLAVAARTLFDADVEGAAGDLGQVVTAFMAGLSKRIDSLLPMPFFLPTPANLRLRKAMKGLDSAVYGFIADRQRRPRDGEQPRLDVLSLLLAARDEDGRGMSERQLRDEVITLFLAGHETTAASLAAALHFVGAHPEVQRRLQAEVDAVLGGRAPGFADLPRLAYTDRVVKEVLRLFPSGPIFDRDAIEDVEIGGHVIPRGTTVLISPYAMQRDARYFADPERFDPDRWLTPQAKNVSRYAYFPFGGGPRICIGASFATMESVLLLARLAQGWTFTSLPGRDLRPIAGFTMRPTEAALRIDRRIPVAPRQSD